MSDALSYIVDPGDLFVTGLLIVVFVAIKVRGFLLYGHKLKIVDAYLLFPALLSLAFYFLPQFGFNFDLTIKRVLLVASCFVAIMLWSRSRAS